MLLYIFLNDPVIVIIFKLKHCIIYIVTKLTTDLQGVEYSEQPQEDRSVCTEGKYSNDPCTPKQWLKDHSCLHSISKRGIQVTSNCKKNCGKPVKIKPYIRSKMPVKPNRTWDSRNTF